MELFLNREYLTPTETLGKLTIKGRHYGFTLEDKIRNRKIKAETAIPAGIYKVRVTYSPRFKTRLPLIYNNEETYTVDSDNGDIWGGVRFHGGNHYKNTEGCILIAKNRHLNSTMSFRLASGEKLTVHNWIQGSLSKELTKLLDDGEEHTLTITDPPNI